MVESDGTCFAETGGFEEGRGRNCLECHEEQRPYYPAFCTLRKTQKKTLRKHSQVSIKQDQSKQSLKTQAIFLVTD